MAKRVVVELVDDITGQPGATTVRFGIDGVVYEVDLADETAMRGMLAPWIAKARRTAGEAAKSRHDLHLIRRWARDNGYPVPARGRIPAATVRAYDQHRLRAS